ncbi:LacI family DNA-binding transcriptional regulator [Paragemmobacter ruber]|uniref:Substrate-binding domain-containing protein n=1 Tax=Paragemmobacter ruber TaxID=1985673 RepID=A0ABW9YA64_9RHOB|nr:LacI family DNA-binding transcriptional regulator [Rhodobacter ruber]NBE09510.1 substrate-binding domain-containing protein [Rhodobacter ruber]
MNSRVTLHDIARAAGVSAATVDRVLNNRDGVRRRTRDVVMSVAHRLGYVSEADLPPDVRSVVQRVTLVFLLPAGTNSFIKLLAQQLEQQAAERPDIDLRIEELEGFNPTTVAARLAELQGEAHGIGLIAQDHPVVREALRSLDRAGVPVVTLASDVQSVPRLAYVGIDNRQAGRLAGQLMGRLLPARQHLNIAMFAGSLSYRGHEEREMGFRSILRDEFRNIHIVEMREVLDDRERAYHEAKSLLKMYPDLAGIYNVGGGTQGIARCLTEAGRAQDVILIGHDATEGNKRLLLEGTMDAVIDQNARVEAREALNLLVAATQGKTYNFIPPRLHVIFRENIPYD